MVGRQLDLATIGKLQIPQMDAQPALASAVALDHVAGADRKPAGKTIDRGTHRKPPEELSLLPEVMADQRDSSETGRRRADIPVNRCGKRVAVRRARPQPPTESGCAPASLILRMSLSENRFPLFRDMRYLILCMSLSENRSRPRVELEGRVFPGHALELEAVVARQLLQRRL